MSATEIMLERETANDESALVVSVHIPSGTPVEKETLLFEIENSKAVQEIWSTSAGILAHNLAVGQEVQFGVPVARIVSPEQWQAESSGAAPAPPAPASVHATPVNLPTPPPRPAEPTQVRLDEIAEHIPPAYAAINPFPPEKPDATLPLAARLEQPRISRAAAALIAEHGLQSASFTSDFITTRVVLEHLGQSQPATTLPARAQTATHSPSPVLTAAAPPVDILEPKAGREIERRKRVEIETLTKGAGDTMLSVLGVVLGPLHIKRSKSDFLSGRITDLVIYEASRLMKKYPNLNSYFAENRIVAHPDVHAGLAIDSGGRLVVYGIEHADRASLPALADQISDAVERYMSNTLSSAEMSRATFTITDLSADELDFVFPLLPRGQSCILGMTHSSVAGYRIFAGFDHRVTEGREIASFLGELRDRLLSFNSEQAKTASTEDAHCAFCGRSADETFKTSKDFGLLKLLNRDGNESLCCASCWNGW